MVERGSKLPVRVDDATGGDSCERTGCQTSVAGSVALGEVAELVGS